MENNRNERKPAGLSEKRIETSDITKNRVVLFLFFVAVVVVFLANDKTPIGMAYII